jgi:hypothetical protein
VRTDTTAPLPPCPTGVAEGTPFDTFEIALCDGGAVPRDKATQYVASDIQIARYQLYSVSRPGDPLPNERYRVAFLSSNHDAEVLTEFHLSETGLIAMTSGTCAAPPLLLTPVPGTEYIVPPPQDRTPTPIN